MCFKAHISELRVNNLFHRQLAAPVIQPTLVLRECAFGKPVSAWGAWMEVISDQHDVSLAQQREQRSPWLQEDHFIHYRGLDW